MLQANIQFLTPLAVCCDGVVLFRDCQNFKNIIVAV